MAGKRWQSFSPSIRPWKGQRPLAISDIKCCWPDESDGQRRFCIPADTLEESERNGQQLIGDPATTSRPFRISLPNWRSIVEIQAELEGPEPALSLWNEQQSFGMLLADGCALVSVASLRPQLVQRIWIQLWLFCNGTLRRFCGEWSETQVLIWAIITLNERWSTWLRWAIQSMTRSVVGEKNPHSFEAAAAAAAVVVR